MLLILQKEEGVRDLRAFMLTTWKDYAYSSETGVGMDVNLFGAIRITVKGACIWTGTSLEQAIQKFNETQYANSKPHTTQSHDHS